jgi:hypothetical protein
MWTLLLRLKTDGIKERFFLPAHKEGLRATEMRVVYDVAGHKP